MRKKPVKSTSVGSDLKRRIVKKQQGGVASYINVNEPVLQYKNWIELPDVFSEYNLPTKLQNEEPKPEAVKYVDTKEEKTKTESEKKPVKQNAFINGLRPIIEQTLKRRGLDTKWTDHLVAQAALESGWGKSESGKFNLSGIKGKGTEKNTKEYINGKMVNTRDTFRDYKDYNDWADNYINLLSNKRYGKAWTLSEDQFMPYIINAGYATDPNYISKYNKVLAEVKKYEDGGRIRRLQLGGTMNGLSPISFWNWFKSKPTENEQKSSTTEEKTPIKKSIHADRIKSSNRFDGRVNWDNIDWLQQFLTKNLGYKTATSINSSIVEEGLGDPKRKQVGGPGYGLLQWEKGTDRYNRMMQYKSDSIINGVDPELQRQAEFIINTVLDKQHRDDWTHGGKGSGYSTGEEARKKFINRNSSIQDKTRAFSLGYVRPKARIKAANKRVQLSHSLDSIYNPKFFPSHENGGRIRKFQNDGIIARDNTRMKAPPPLIKKKEEARSLPNNQTYLSPAPSKELQDTYNRDKKIQNAVDFFYNMGNTYLDWAKLGLSVAQPEAGLVLGGIDAGVAAYNNDWTSAGVQAGLELLPYVGKGINAVSKTMGKTLSRAASKEVTSKVNKFGNLSSDLSSYGMGLNDYKGINKDLEELYNYLSDGSTLEKLKKIDSELGTDYYKVAQQYVDIAKTRPNKAVFPFDPDLIPGMLKRGSAGTSTVRSEKFLTNPLDPNEYVMAVLDKRPPSTVGHEVKHLLDLMEWTSRLSPEELAKIKTPTDVHAAIKNSPRLKKLLEDNIVDYNTFKSKFKTSYPNATEEEILKKYNYYSNPFEVNSQMHPIVQERIKTGRSGVFDYGNNRAAFEWDLKKAQVNDGDNALDIIYNMIVKDKNKFIDALNKYGYATVPATIGGATMLNDKKK